MRAIVTGGAGFIGSHLVDALLAQGDEVHVVDDLSFGRRENVAAGAELHELDVRSSMRDLFTDVRPEVCFHLAATVDVTASVERPEEDASVNVGGTANVLGAAAHVGARVVFASSGGAVYGEAPEPVNEDAPLEPSSPYGAAKLAAEAYVAMYRRMSGAAHVSLRIANAYGPRQLPKGEAAVVAVFLHALARDERPRIFGDGRQTRDFVYVADIVDAFLRASSAGDGVYNVGTGRTTTVGDLYELAQRVADVEPSPAEHVDERPGEIRDNVLDASRAERELGWRARTSLEEGLRLTWEWVQTR
jgi:UDP-glucose 4-epimerase